MRTRKAIVPDAQQICDLVQQYSGDGTLLPRRYGEICENIRDFVVTEHRGRIIGCGALHIYGPHLAEVRSIAVDPGSQHRGAGQRIVKMLLKEAAQQQITRTCLFTRIPEFFSRLGFNVAAREELPDKIFKDCLACPRLHCCDEVAMLHGEVDAHTAPAYDARSNLIQIAK